LDESNESFCSADRIVMVASVQWKKKFRGFAKFKEWAFFLSIKMRLAKKHCESAVLQGCLTSNRIMHLTLYLGSDPNYKFLFMDIGVK